MPVIIDTPEAGIPGFNPLQKSNVHDPQVLSANAATALTLYDRSLEPDIDKIVVQNCGISAVKLAINQTPTDVLFHNILAGCSAQDDGLGSVQTYSREDGIKTLQAFNLASAIRVSVTKYYRQGSI